MTISLCIPYHIVPQQGLYARYSSLAEYLSMIIIPSIEAITKLETWSDSASEEFESPLSPVRVFNNFIPKQKSKISSRKFLSSSRWICFEIQHLPSYIIHKNHNVYI